MKMDRAAHIVWQDGTKFHSSYEGCLREAWDLYCNGVVGHDGDITEVGDCTLIWECEQDAEHDADGKYAVGCIFLD